MPVGEMKHLTFTLLAASVATAYAASPEFVPGQVIVKYRSDAAAISRVSLLLRGVTPIQNLGENTQLVTVPVGSTISTTIAQLKQDPNVVFAEPNYIAHASVTPNDQYYVQYQPELRKIQADLAWNYSTGSGIRVGVLDTGIQANHPDLTGKVAVQYDFVDNDSTAQDGNGHGTHTAGTVAARTNNSIGVASVGYDAQLVIGRVLGNDGSGSYAAIVSGIRWAADQRAIIISMSLGGSSGSQALSDAIDYAAGKGCLVIAAAGNSNSNLPSYPAYYTKVLAVGAVDNNDVKASFSNYGSWVDIVAPGVNIASTYPTNQYAQLSGTSMATPIVAGSAALVWKYWGTANGPTFVRNKLTQKADFVSFGGESKPRVNPYKAITAP